MGRLWQTLILSSWNDAFIAIPVESLIYQHKNEYYLAISKSIKHSDSAFFIEFMLKMILDALEEFLNDEINDGVNIIEIKILELLREQPLTSQDQLAKKLEKSKNTIQIAIRILKKLDKIKRVGSIKTGYWQVLDES